MTKRAALTVRINLILLTLRNESMPTAGFIRLNDDLAALLKARKAL